MIRPPLFLCLALLAGFGLGWMSRGWMPGPVHPAQPVQPAAIAPPTASAPPAAAGGAAASPAPEIGFRTGMTPRLDEPDPSFTPEVTVPLLEALENGAFSIEWRGNAREQLRMTAINRSDKATRLTLPAGQSFESAHGYVVLPRTLHIDFKPGQTRLETLGTLATASTNMVEMVTFVATPTQQPRLSELLAYLAEHPEVPIPAAQTAALVILENLPASAFARFAPAGSDLPSQWDASAFKVDTVDLVRALVVLRGMGLPDEQLAITIDPQTRIEAMIDPLAHALAMQYYGIAPQEEWAYWKRELLEGEPSTRHYALYGIARYYPEVALQMLPGWAREKRTNPVFRQTALSALAEIRRPETLPVLKTLEGELAAEPELRKAARDAVAYLETALKAKEDEALPVHFRFGGAPLE